MWSNFYDDYITFALSGNSKNTEDTVCLFLDLLDWKYKAAEFSHQFSALGIVVDLKNFSESFVEFCNTAKRSEELSDAIQNFIDSGSMSLLESQRLRGRMQFADGQLFGRIGQLCLRSVSNHGFSGLGPKLRPDCIKALFRFKNFLSENKPRRIGCVFKDVVHLHWWCLLRANFQWLAVWDRRAYLRSFWTACWILPFSS